MSGSISLYWLYNQQAKIFNVSQKLVNLLASQAFHHQQARLDTILIFYNIFEIIIHQQQPIYDIMITMILFLLYHRKKSPQIDMTKVHISIRKWKSFQIDKEIHAFVISIWDDFFQWLLFL